MEVNRSGTKDPNKTPDSMQIATQSDKYLSNIPIVFITTIRKCQITTLPIRYFKLKKKSLTDASQMSDNGRFS